MIRKFKLLKSLPNVKAGTVGEDTGSGLVNFAGFVYDVDFILLKPEWFEEVKIKKENGIYSICDKCGTKIYPTKEDAYDKAIKEAKLASIAAQANIYNEDESPEHYKAIKQSRLLGEKIAIKKNFEWIVEKIRQLQQEVDKLRIVNDQQL